MGFNLKIKGMDKFINYFNERRRKTEMDKDLRGKIQQQLELLRTDIIQYIDAEKHGVPNSPLTILVKNSSRPLVDHGDLRQSINWRTKVLKQFIHGGVGVLRTKTNKDGKKLWNIATSLHEGFLVKVTPEVRAAVFAEMHKRRGKKVRFESNSSVGKKIWKVKGRPFIREPFESAEERIITALGDGVTFTLKKD
jgi:hypothetical protein